MEMVTDFAMSVKSTVLAAVPTSACDASSKWSAFSRRQGM